MSTQRQLWLGFGTLLAILVFTVVGTAIWFRALGGSMREITDRGEPARQAAFEMQVHSIDTGLNVLNYLHTRAPAYRERVVADAADFRRAYSEYADLAPAQEDVVAQHVAAVSEEYFMLGTNLIDRRDKLDDLHQELSDNLNADLDDLDAQVRTYLSQPKSAAAKLEELLRMRDSLSAAGLSLGRLRAELRSGEGEVKWGGALRDFRTSFAKLSAMLRTKAEVGWARAFGDRVDTTLDQMNQAAAEIEEEQQDLQRFLYLRIRLDTLLEEGIVKAAHRDLANAGEDVHHAFRSILISAIVLLGIGVIVSLATGIFVSRGIMRTEQTLRVTLTSIGDAVIATDANGRIIFMNPVAESLTGWRQQEAESRPLLDVLRMIDEETRLPVPDPISQVSSRGVVIGLTPHTLLIGRDGSERPIDDSAAPMLNDQGRLVGAVLVFRDASKRRSDEQALRDADRRKDEFLAMLAHELRNPLAPVRNGLYILGTTGLDATTRRQTLEMMLRQVQNMTRMIDDLLDVSRITRGKIELRKEALELGALVRRVADVMAPEFAAANRHLIVRSAPQSLWVEADATRLDQVVGNLLSNALKYTKTGGRTWLSVEAENGEAAVRVRDDGIGIEPEMLPQIFDLFAQADRSLARSQEGLGIGLTLVRTLVEMHGGTVSAESAGAGQGSEFEVRLPLLAPQDVSAHDGRPDVAAGTASAELRVLVVDDNVDSADSLALLLTLRGHDVHTAHDGASAITMAKSLDPRLILLDIGLPGVDGYEVARRLRRNNGSSEMVLVAMTGYGRPEDISRSREAGFDDHLVKPVEMDALQALLRRLCGPMPS